MRKGKILVVDDDDDILRLVSEALKARGCEVITASAGTEGVAKCLSERPDLVILDVELPDMDGIQVCQEIRKDIYVPVVFLTVRDAETDVVLGLGVGADTYITKPFRIAELVARVEAFLRRETIYAERKKERRQIRIRDIILDLTAYEVRKNEELVDLTATEYRLLLALAEHTDQVLTRDQLLDYVWDLKAEGIYTRTVDVHIGRLRRKIEDDPSRPKYIVTIPGVGYKMPG